jgi:hypothetical protein
MPDQARSSFSVSSGNFVYLFRSPIIQSKMDRIILEVDDRSAKKWKYASQDKKERLSKSIGQLIDRSLAAEGDNFWDFIEKISSEAESNGLTEERLAILLNEE